MPNHVPHPREDPRHGGIRSGLSQMIKTSYSDLGLNVLFPSSSSYLIRRASPSPSSGRTAVGMGTRGVPRLIFSLPSAFVPWCLAPAESGGMLGVASPGSMARWVSGDTAIGVPVGSCSLCVGAVFDSLQRGPWSWAHSCYLGRAVRTETDSLSSSPLHHHPAPAPGDPVSLDTFEERECFWGKEDVYVGGRRHGAFPRLGTSGGHLGGSSQTSQHLVADFQTSQAPIWAHLGKFKAFQFCHLAWGRGWGRLFCTFFQA